MSSSEKRKEVTDEASCVSGVVGVQGVLCVVGAGVPAVSSESEYSEQSKSELI